MLIFGAHPDDCDIKAGGTAALYARQGHQVQMISLTNGDAGHYEMGGAPLAWRRRQEAAASAKCLGVEYVVLDNHDGELTPSLAVRQEIIARIRNYKPDVVMGPRPWDYHPDHRATAEVVMDALYMCTVPNICSRVEHLRRMPVAAYVWDDFSKPYPFDPDVVVNVDPVIEQKLDALHCHTSQVYEWLPYNREELDRVPEGESERRTWLKAWYEERFAPVTALYEDELIERYGQQEAGRIQHIEAFEISEYGAPAGKREIARLFPF
ncbi:MAG: PIG-L family deacetylase [Chloroflexota bacterium]|nr:PIG-L family deacetylase [Chloroflexota bacterium]